MLKIETGVHLRHLRLNPFDTSPLIPPILTSDGKETQPTCMGIGVGGDLSVRMLL
jgi:hypothetical protein